MRAMLGSVFTDQLTAWATLAAGVGTVGAVLIALYRDTWRAARRRPLLSLDFADSSTAQGAGFEGDVRGDLPAIRLRVRNAKGRNTAKDVEVLLSVWWRGRDEPFTWEGQIVQPRWHQAYEQRPLLWAHEYEAGFDVTRSSLPAGVSRELEFVRFGRPSDVASVTEGRARASALSRELHVCRDEPDEHDGGDNLSATYAWAFLVVPPFGGWDTALLYDHLTYRFRLIVTATDVDAVAYDAVLRLAADWDGDDREAGSVAFTFDWEGLNRARDADAEFSL